MIAPMRCALAWIVGVGCAGLLLAFGSSAVAADELPLQCGTLRNHYGPFDYRTDKSKLPIVEGAHFDAGIESLTRGKSGHLGGDLDYTLRAFPNHHRALLAMMRLAERDKVAKPLGARYTDECYFLRAEYFRPDDGMVKMLAGIFLMKKGRNSEAIERLEAAKKLDPRDANLQYNLGLAYFRLGRYDESLEHAHRAYAMGFALPGLKGMLAKAGKWRDPVPGQVMPESDAEAVTPAPTTQEAQGAGTQQ